MSLNVWDVMFFVILFGGWYDIVISFICLEVLHGKKGMKFKEFNPFMNWMLKPPGNYKYLAYYTLFIVKFVITIPIYLLIVHVSPMFGLIYCFFYLLHVVIVIGNTGQMIFEIQDAVKRTRRNKSFEDNIAMTIAGSMNGNSMDDIRETFNE